MNNRYRFNIDPQKPLYAMTTGEFIDQVLEPLLIKTYRNLGANTKIISEKTLTISEICKKNKISRTKFWSIRKKYNIPSYPFGKRLRFKQSEVLEAIRKDNL